MEARETAKVEKRMDSRACRQCTQVNTLDQWYELPETPYLVCSGCAATNTRARPIHINTIADRLLEAYGALQRLKQQNDELKELAEGAPGLEKQLRRLVRAIERNAQATERVDRSLAEMTENLSPRWLFHVKQAQRDAARKLMTRLSKEAGPGAILEVSEEEHQMLQGMVKL